MRITCPQCGFFRELPDNKIPVTSTMATCPKCGHRFKFRADEPSVTPERPSFHMPPTADEEISSWRRQGTNAARLHRQPPPSAHWEPEENRTPHEQTPPAATPGEPAAPAPSYADEGDETPAHHNTPVHREPEPEAEAVYRPSRRVGTPPQRDVDWSETPANETAAPRHSLHEEPAAPYHAPEPEPQSRQEPPQDTAGETQSSAATHDQPVSGQDKPKAAAPEPEKPATSADGVRDIWARLQAMDEKPARKHEARHTAPDEDDEPEPQRERITDPIPWERQESYGFFPGLFLTLKKVLFQPVDFFEGMPEGRPKAKALVFNLLISEFLLLIDFLWTLMGLRGSLGDGQTTAFTAFAGTPSLSFLTALLLVPLVLSVGIYLDAWLTHVLLLLFRSAKKGFNETFRVMCYSAAPTVLSAVPVAGQILSPVILIWYMALQAIGLKKVHEAAYTQTLAAIFIKWSLYLFLLLAMLQSISPAH